MENQHNTNVAELPIELSLRQSTMAEFEWYKECCKKQGDIGYYDTFKNQDMKYIYANTRCINPAEIWDDIIESQESRSYFEFQNKWIKSAARRLVGRLVEPLDIAESYRTFGHCTTYERPKRRHKVLQEWMEDKDKEKPRTRLASLTQDSCFWAHLEEPLNYLSDGIPKRYKVLHKWMVDKEKIRSSRGKKPMIYRFRESDGYIYRFWDSKGHNFGIKSRDPTKMPQEAYDMLVDMIDFFESLRLYKLFLRAMIRCFIAMNTFLSLKVESSDSKANIQDIKAKIQEKFNYNGNCNVKIGIIPCPGGEFKVWVTPF